MSEDLFREGAAADETLRGATDQAVNQEATRELGETSGEGSAVAVGQAGEAIVVERPAPGQTVEIQAVAGQTYVLDFAPNEAQVQVQGDNLILAFDDNGDGTPDSQIVFLDLVDVVEGAGEAPTFQIAGVDIGSDVLLGQALALAGQGEAPLDEVAAGPGAQGGGATAYDDDLGDPIDLLDAEGVIPPTELQFGLVDLEDEITLLEEDEDDLPPEAENTPPEADPVLTQAVQADGGEGGGVPPELLDALVQLGVPTSTTVIHSETVSIAGPNLPGSVQYVFFTLTEPSAVTISTDGPTIDPVIHLFIDDGTLDLADLLATDDDDGSPAGSFSNAIINSGDEIGILPAGSYVVAVSDFSFSPEEAIAGLNNSTDLTGDVTVTIETSDGPVFFKQLDVDGSIGDDDSGVIADFGGADAETALGDLTFTLQSSPTYGQLILVTSGGATSLLSPGDTFTSEDTVWWIATQDQIDDFLSQEGAPEFLPNVEFDYSVTDADGASATAPVVITIPREVTPPDVTLDLYGGDDCIEEDSALGDINNEVSVTVTPDGDDLLTEIVLSGFQADWVYNLDGLDTDGAGGAVVVTDNIAGDGTVTITFSPGTNSTYNGSFSVQPPADSDVDHPTVTATATVVDPADPGLTTSGNGTLDIHVDANADGGEGSAGDDGDGVHLSVALAVADDPDDNATFQAGETGTVTVSATFDDFQDGSETHTVTVTAPEGFTIGDVVGDLPAGVSVQSNDGTTLVLLVDSQDGDGQDGVGAFEVTFEVTNVDAPDGAAPFTAEARAVETSTGDEECDPSEADNVATVTDDATATVADIAPPEVALSLPDQVDCIAEDSTTADASNVVSLAVTPQGDDLLTEIVLSGFQADWVYNLDGLDTDGAGGAVVVTDNIAGDGTVTITFSPGTNSTYNGSFSVQPPADSDVDHPTITASATAVDPADPALSTTGEGTLDVHVDAVADDVTVNITVNDSDDDNDTFEANETGTVHVSATFGDYQDGSETHRVTVMVPVGFVIGALVDLPPGVTFELGEPGEVIFTVPSGTPSFDYEFDVTAPDTVTDGENFTFEATATADETNTQSSLPDDVECTEENNHAQDDDSDLVYGGVEDIDPVLVVGQNVDDNADQEEDHVIQNPEGEPDGEIVGNGGDDVLIGDVGGGVLVGKTMNLVLILDTSDSMEANIPFNDTTTTRIEALDQAVEDLLDELAATPGLTVRLHLISFATDVKDEATFDIITNGVVDPVALQAAKDFILGPGDDHTVVADGATNYEAGFNAAYEWFNNPANTLDDPDINKTIFVSDGLPNHFYRGNDTTDSLFTTNAQEALNHVLGHHVDPNGVLVDSFSEFAALQGPFKGVNGTVDAVGINVNLGGEAALDQVDGDGSDNITSGEQLADVLSNLTATTQLEAAGDDVIVGNGGADLIFGDTLFTDNLKALLSDGHPGNSLAPGSGWSVIDALVNDGFFDQDDLLTQEQEILAFLRNPANIETYQFGRESVNSEGEGRAGGNDLIDGGAGADLIFGQEGNDTIDGGAGADIIVGGTGNDSMTGGEGADTFLWTDQFNAGEVDTVTDFDDASGGDTLDLTALLEGSPTESGAGLQGYLNITYDNVTGDTTIAIDVNGDGSGYTDVAIVCEGVDLTGGSVDQAGIIQSLIDSGQLETNGIV